MKSNSSLIYSLSLLVGDFLALLAAFAGGFLIRGDLYNAPVAHPISGSTYLGILLLLTPFWILIFALLGLYNSSIYEKRFPEAGRLLIGSFVGFLFVGTYAYAKNTPVFPSKMVPVWGFILAFVFLLIIRNFVRWSRSVLFSYGIGITNLLLVGNTKIAVELASELADSKISGYRLLGIVSSESKTAQKYPGLPHFKNFHRAVKKLRANDIHAIVQTELYADTDKNNEILEFAQTHHIGYRFVPGNSELFVGNIAVELFRGSVPVIAVHQTALFGWGRILKRIFDLVIGSILIVITSPFILMSAVLVLVFGGRGGIFFKQTRLTRFNQPFRVYKFRTAKAEFSGLTHEQAFKKLGQPRLLKTFYDNGEYLPDDPRYTTIGRFLRKTSLDELPQLFNVMKGNLSLVGPRALIPKELDNYEKRHDILSVKSGVTGLAQISGRRNISIDERRRLDLFYVQNWSLWLDITILVKTIRVVFRGKGAA